MTDTSDRTPALELSGIEMHYGFVRALDDIDIHVMPGEVRRPARRQRRRQVDAAQGDVGGAQALARHHPVHGEEHSFHAPSDAAAAGIQMVYQDLVPGRAAGHLHQPQHRPGAAPQGPARLARLRRPQGDAQELGGRARPARRPHRADDPAGGDALRRPAPGRRARPQRDPRHRRDRRRPAPRRADRRARLRADQERRGADPADGRPGHRDRARHPRPPALLRGRGPDGHPQPGPQGRRRARRGLRPRPRRRLDHRLQRVDVRRSAPAG